MLSDLDTEEILRQFPPILAAFAYGSGVIEQGGYSYSYSLPNNRSAFLQEEANTNTPPLPLPMVDLIFVVEDSMNWHEDNKASNPEHYTTPIPFSASYIAYIQDNFGAGMWYNAMVRMNTSRYPNRLMKYGVINRSKFIEDLTQWKYLYVAGRLHKPVKILKLPLDTMITEAIEINKSHAVRTSLLLLPNTFTELDLFMKTASLSYIGDPRMGIGENPKKVENLVTPIVPVYKELYIKTLNEFAASVNLVIPSLHDVHLGKKGYMQDICPNIRWKLCEGLPSTMKKLLMIKGRERYLREKPPGGNAIRSALSSIVARSASAQSIKGIITAGIVKSSYYLFQKIKKRFA